MRQPHYWGRLFQIESIGGCQRWRWRHWTSGKISFFLPNVHNMFFSHRLWFYFLRLPTRLIRVSKIHVGFLVLRKVECVLTYIFLHRVHMCFRVHTHRTVWVSTFSTAMGKTRCWIKRATLERVTVSKWKHIPSYRNKILMRCGKYRFFLPTLKIYFFTRCGFKFFMWTTVFLRNRSKCILFRVTGSGISTPHSCFHTVLCLCVHTIICFRTVWVVSI